MQRAWLHGVGVDAPAAWARNAMHCGQPTADTLVVGSGGNETCATWPQSHASVVWLGAYDKEPLRPNVILGDAALGRAGVQGLRATRVAGEPARTGRLRSTSGGTTQIVLFPQRRAYVTVHSGDQHLVEQVLRSIQVTAVDPATHCRVHTNEYDDPRRLPVQPGDALVPGAPAMVTACGYVDDWLEQTATMRGDRLQRLLTALDAAPAPTEERSGDDWPGCVAVQRQSPSPVEPMLLTFAYPDGSTRLVVARILWCTRWQSYVTTGSYTRRITPQILTALPPVWMDYPDPDSMQVTR